MKPLSLYIHIPFCKRKCLYCDFPSFDNCSGEYENYTAALINEITEKSKDFKNYNIETIFIGGGTPTVLPSSYIANIMEAVFKNYNICENAEITMEGNPGTVDFESLKHIRQTGVNRISLGLQAWQDRLLSKLGRVYNMEEFKKNFSDIRKAGFDNINLDLMFALPSQTIDEWKETLENVVGLAPEHISAYSLIIEEGTPFYDMYTPINEDLDRQMYEVAKDILAQNGYQQYEISNFAKEGFNSRHNIVYWQTKEYIGFGLGSHSYFDGKRFHNTYDMKNYILSKGASLYEDIEQLSQRDMVSEFMFMGLRMNKGVSLDEFYGRFSLKAEEYYKDELNELFGEKLLIIEGRDIKLTKKGIDLSNYVFGKFI